MAIATLDLDKVSEISRGAATQMYGADAVNRVLTTATQDSDGNDALRVIIVLTEKGARRIEGKRVIDTMIEIQEQLRQAGEERYPIIGYATEKELRELADT